MPTGTETRMISRISSGVMPCDGALRTARKPARRIPVQISTAYQRISNPKTVNAYRIRCKIHDYLVNLPDI